MANNNLKSESMTQAKGCIRTTIGIIIIWLINLTRAHPATAGGGCCAGGWIMCGSS